MNYCVTYNKDLYPSLKKCPDHRMVGQYYVYIPKNIITQTDGLNSGEQVKLLLIPQKGDIICTVIRAFSGGPEYQIFWKDLVKL